METLDVLEEISAPHGPSNSALASMYEIGVRTTRLADYYTSRCSASPELEQAKVKLQEANMWANAAVARNQKD